MIEVANEFGNSAKQGELSIFLARFFFLTVFLSPPPIPHYHISGLDC